MGATGRPPYALLVDALTPLVPDPEAAKLPAWAAVHGLASLWIDGIAPVPDDRGAAVDAVLDLVVKGLGIAGPRPPVP